MNKINDKKQFLYLYNKGLNDVEIADYFKCVNRSVCSYRIKLGLRANIRPKLITRKDFDWAVLNKKQRDGKNAKEYYKLNKHKIKERHKKYHKKYIKKYKIKILQKQREYYKLNKDKINLKWKEYYKLNKDKILQQHKEYYKKNKEKWVVNHEFILLV